MSKLLERSNACAIVLTAPDGRSALSGRCRRRFRQPPAGSMSRSHWSVGGFPSGSGARRSVLARTTRGGALTEAGVTFRDDAAQVCAEIDSALETILPPGDLRDRLRIAAPLTFGLAHLALVYAELARRHPLRRVHASYSERFADLVGEGFDRPVRVGYLSDSNLVARRVGPIHGMLVASPGYIIREDGARPHAGFILKLEGYVR
jgi:LysR substrate binding domain